MIAGNLWRQDLPRSMARRRLRGCGTPAVAVSQSDDFVTARVNLGGHRRGLVGFGAAVGEEGFFKLPGRYLGQFRSEPRLRSVGVKRRSVIELFDLIDDGFGDVRVNVADACGQHSAEAVEVFIAAL